MAKKKKQNKNLYTSTLTTRYNSLKGTNYLHSRHENFIDATRANISLKDKVNTTSILKSFRDKKQQSFDRFKSGVEKTGMSWETFSKELSQSLLNTDSTIDFVNKKIDSVLDSGFESLVSSQEETIAELFKKYMESIDETTSLKNKDIKLSYKQNYEEALSKTALIALRKDFINSLSANESTKELGVNLNLLLNATTSKSGSLELFAALAGINHFLYERKTQSVMDLSKIEPLRKSISENLKIGGVVSNIVGDLRESIVEKAISDLSSDFKTSIKGNESLRVDNAQIVSKVDISFKVPTGEELGISVKSFAPYSFRQQDFFTFKVQDFNSLDSLDTVLSLYNNQTTNKLLEKLNDIKYLIINEQFFNKEGSVINKPKFNSETGQLDIPTVKTAQFGLDKDIIDYINQYFLALSFALFGQEIENKDNVINSELMDNGLIVSPRDGLVIPIVDILDIIINTYKTKGTSSVANFSAFNFPDAKNFYAIKREILWKQGELGQGQKTYPQSLVNIGSAWGESLASSIGVSINFHILQSALSRYKNIRV